MGMFAEKLVTVRDPICGMTLDLATANGTSIGRKTYFFCSAFCRSRFDADPRNAFMEPLAEGTCPSLWERKVRPESAGGAILATAVRRNALIAHGRGLEPFEHGDVPLIRLRHLLPASRGEGHSISN